MNDTQLLELIPEYVLGTLEGEEQAAIEALLKRSSEARQLFAEYDALLLNAALLTTPLQTAPAHLTADFAERLRAEAGSTPASAPSLTVLPKAPRSTLPPILLVAAIILVIIGVGVLFRAVLPASDTKQEIAQILNHSAARRVVVDFPNNPGVSGSLVYLAAEKRAVLEVTRLQALPNTQAYEVWLIDSVPRASGVFNSEGDTTRYLVRADAPIESYKTVALTVEPAAGNDKPSTAPIGSGKISQQ